MEILLVYLVYIHIVHYPLINISYKMIYNNIYLLHNLILLISKNILTLYHILNYNNNTILIKRNKVDIYHLLIITFDNMILFFDNLYYRVIKLQDYNIILNKILYIPGKFWSISIPLLNSVTATLI